MTRSRALALYLKDYGDNLTISEISFIKKALKFYDEDINDISYVEEIENKVYMYAYFLKFKMPIENKE